MSSTEKGSLAPPKQDAEHNPSPTPSMIAEEERRAIDNMSTTDVDEEAQVVDAVGEKVDPAGAPSSTGDASHEYPTGMRLSMIIVALVLSIFLVALDMTIVATAIPKITDEFKRLDEVSWYGASFFMCVAAFQSTCKCLPANQPKPTMPAK